MSAVRKAARDQKQALTGALAQKETELEAYERKLVEAEQNDLLLLKSWISDAERWEARVRRRERNGMTALQVAGVLLSGVVGASILSTRWGLIIGAIAAAIAASSSLLNVWGRVHFISQEKS